MCQDGCMKILRKNPNKWFSAKEIMESLKLSSSVNSNLLKLYNQKCVKRKTVKHGERMIKSYVYQVKE